MMHRPLLLLAVCALARGATYEVGAGKAYATLGALPTLAAGDLVEVSPGTYNEVKRWTASGTAANPIVIRGVGATRPVIDATGKTVDGALPNPRAVFQIEGSWITIENFELVNARNGNNGSGVRICAFGATSDHDVIRSCRVHDCDMGIMSGQCDHTLIESCEIDHNGTSSYSGYSHNFYLGGGATTVRGCWIHDSLYGQNVKSRGHYTELLCNWIADSQDGEVGLVDEAETIPADSNALLVGNVIVSKDRGAGWNTTRFVMWGSDLGGAHTGTMYAFNNTFVAGATSINFLWSNRAESAIVARNNVFVGSASISASDIGTVSGSGNWMPTGAGVPAGFSGSVLGAAPGFVDAGARDYRLVAGSPCIGIGSTSLSYLDGAGAAHDGTPTLMWQALGTLAARPSDGALDAGAFEYGSGSSTSGTATGTGGSSTGGATTSGSSTGASGGAPPADGGGSGRSRCGLGGGVGLLLALALRRMPRRATYP